MGVLVYTPPIAVSAAEGPAFGTPILVIRVWVRQFSILTGHAGGHLVATRQSVHQAVLDGDHAKLETCFDVEIFSKCFDVATDRGQA